jgi:hypothetical protein
MDDQEKFVVVVEHDGSKDGRPIVWEQYIDGDHATIEAAKARKRRLSGRYGRARIARLVFIEDDDE